MHLVLTLFGPQWARAVAGRRGVAFSTKPADQLPSCLPSLEINHDRRAADAGMLQPAVSGTAELRQGRLDNSGAEHRPRAAAALLA